MKTGQQIECIKGDKKGMKGTILAIDEVNNRVQVQWPMGYMKTWMKIEALKAI